MSRIPLGAVMAIISVAPVLRPSESMGDSFQAALPRGRSHHVAVWTGDEMVIWGGFVGRLERTDTGAVYTSVTDSWKSTSTQSAPPAVSPPSGVWTGSELIAWGGWAKVAECRGEGLVCATNIGGRYDPVSDSWKRSLLSRICG